MLSQASEGHLTELVDDESLEMIKVLNVFMTEELISRKIPIEFLTTTYVIGPAVRNRLLTKKQTHNDSFNRHVHFLELGDVNTLLDAAMGFKEIGAQDSEDNSSEIADSHEGDIGAEGEVINQTEQEISEQSGVTIEVVDEAKPITPVSNTAEVIKEDARTCQSVEESELAPKVKIRFIPRRGINVLIETTDFSSVGFTTAELREKVSSYFEEEE